MKTLAAVTTAKGTGAISSIQLSGIGAGGIIEKIFEPVEGKKCRLETGNILVGDIVDGGQIVDHVVVGCEGQGDFSISCHGNPIIVEMIMKLLKDEGAELVTAEELLGVKFADEDGNTIVQECKLAQLKAVTLEGAKVIANQANAGLSRTATNWLEGEKSLEKIKAECERILASSETAGLIINGAKVVIAGPPNSGKSTLLNCLCGTGKSIVTETAGTTRDWVGARCRAESLLMELIDTAGLDEGVTGQNDIDKESQKRAAELLTDCDVVLFVLDGSTAEKQQIKFNKGKKVIVVLNKSDIGCELYEEQLGLEFDGCVRISAKTGEGIDELVGKIRRVLGVAGFDLTNGVCFTERQKRLLEGLLRAKNVSEAESAITELLNGGVCI
jgi:tRNA modification GTPase